ncbi:MAG: flavin reductase family protein [Bacteroidales bacterium]|jgi:flavin reductase (DIM6/NTAB) family NADH-FMN oxidoreductase RutF|nr:flavin reductase family protein [Bacteroidales bacterium]
MKKIKLGAYPYIYPMPTVIVGTLIHGKPNFITISYVGVVQHKPPMVSVTLVKGHYSNTGIKESKTFSINIPNTKLLKETDFTGMHSGDKIDKASLFSVFYGNLKTAPMIAETPLNLECKLVEVINLKNDSEIFIGEIVETYSSKKFIREGYPYMKKLDPILFSINSNSYYNIGRRIGWAWKTGLKINPAKCKK